MSIVEVRPSPAPVFTGRQRPVAAGALLLGPLLMLVAFLLATVAQRSAPGQQDAAIWVAAPVASSWASAFDLLSAVAMIGTAVVLLLVTRRWSPAAAWIGGVAMIVQACGLAGVSAMESLAGVLAIQGVAVDDLQAGMDGVTSHPSGIALGVVFFPTIVLGLVALGIALWRTPWVPRFVPVSLWLVLVADMALPDEPILRVGPFALLLAAMAVLARRIMADGAPQPAADVHTA
jgi:hypothetical protein